MRFSTVRFTSITRLHLLVVLLFSLYGLVACSSSSGENNATIRGNVLAAVDPASTSRAGTFTAIAGVQVSIGPVRAITNASGNFSLNISPSLAGPQTLSVGDPINQELTVDFPGGTTVLTLSIQQETDGSVLVDVLRVEEKGGTISPLVASLAEAGILVVGEASNDEQDAPIEDEAMESEEESVEDASSDSEILSAVSFSCPEMTNFASSGQNCGIRSVFTGMQTGDTTQLISTFGSNLDVPFMIDPLDQSAEATDLSILGAPAHTCSVSCSADQFGDTMSVVCVNGLGGSCSEILTPGGQ